jgi:hypothetical protein
MPPTRFALTLNIEAMDVFSVPQHAARTSAAAGGWTQPLGVALAGLNHWPQAAIADCIRTAQCPANSQCFDQRDRSLGQKDSPSEPGLGPPARLS